MVDAELPETVTDSVETASDSAVSRLQKSKKFHQQFAEALMANYQVSGKTLPEWQKYFRLDVPPDLNPQLAIELDLQLMERFQEASFFKAEAELRLSALSGIVQSAHREAFNALYVECKQSNERMPAKDTLALLTEQKIAQEKDALIHAEIEVNFWKSILASLSECRKLIETATISISVEAKALLHTRHLDTLNRNATHQAYNDTYPKVDY